MEDTIWALLWGLGHEIKDRLDKIIEQNQEAIDRNKAWIEEMRVASTERRALEEKWAANQKARYAEQRQRERQQDEDAAFFRKRTEEENRLGLRPMYSLFPEEFDRAYSGSQGERNKQLSELLESKEVVDALTKDNEEESAKTSS
jgi:hypothetical protein